MKRIAITAAATALSATALFAATDIGMLDTDGDNFVSKTELMTAFPEFDASFFDEIDANRDNRLSAAELETAGAQTILSRYGAEAQSNMPAEAGASGFESYAEMAAMYPAMTQIDFDEIDENNDGRLSAAELQTPMGNEIIARIDVTTTVPGVGSMDTDGDNFVSFEELQVVYPKVPQLEFDSVDANTDGRLDSEELSGADALAMLNRY